MQGFDGAPVVGALARAVRVGLWQQASFTGEPQHRIALPRRVGQFVVEIAFEQTEFRTQPHVVAGEIAGRRRQIVRGHRRQAQPPVTLGRARIVPVRLEPQDRRARDTATGQVLLHPAFEHPQVLTDHHGPGALRLEHEDPDECLVVVPHVGTLVGGTAVGDPPGAEQPKDVVDAEPAGVSQRRPQHVPERPVSEFGEAVRPPRWLVPVLAAPVEVVGGCPHRHSGGQRIAQRPRVGAVAAHPDRQVVHDADVHPRSPRRPLRRRELLVAHPLQPAVKIDAVGELRAQPLEVRMIRGRCALSPALRPVPELLGERAPQREIGERAAARDPERLEPEPAGGGPRHPVHVFEHIEFRAQRRVTVEPLALAVRPGELRGVLGEALAVLAGQVDGLGDVLDP